jgi:predicted aspartyl protease
MKQWLGRAIAAVELVLVAGYAGGPPRIAAASQHGALSRGDAAVHLVADGGGGCRTARLGEATVATLKNSPIVTLFANGAAVVVLLDTGAQTTILRPPVAQRIGAQHPRIEFQRQMHGIAGNLQTGEVELRSFAIAGVAIPWRRVRVAPVNVASVFSTPLDGLLGVDALSSFDVDLDLPDHRMVLYEKQTCASATPTWTEPYAKISAGRSLGDHLFFPAQLDGRKIHTFIDTGSQFTVLSTRAALALGVTEAVLAHDRAISVHGAAAEQLSAHIHRFAQLTVGAEVIRNPEIVVTDVRFNDADLVLGIDFLRSRRVWLSYGSQQIFLSHRG